MILNPYPHVVNQMFQHLRWLFPLFPNFLFLDIHNFYDFMHVEYAVVELNGQLIKATLLQELGHELHNFVVKYQNLLYIIASFCRSYDLAGF